MSRIVRLGDDARATILRELRAYRHRLDRSEEIGGWLLSEKGSPEVSIATPLANGRSGHNEMWLEPTDPFKVMESSLRLGLPALEIAGHWHVHPGGPSTPSDGDRRSWRVLLEINERYGCEQIVGVIVTDTAGGWDCPLFTAYRTYRPAPGKYPVVEPVVV